MPQLTQTALLRGVIDCQREVMACGPDRAQVMQVITERTRTFMSADAVFIEFAEGDEMVYRALVGADPALIGLRLSMENSLSGRCIHEGRALYSRDSEQDDRVDLEACRRVGVRSMVVAPLLHGATTVGVLKAASGQPDAFTDQQVLALELLAGCLGAALAQATESEAAKRAAEEAAIFFEKSIDLLAIAGESGRLERVNPAWMQTLGWSPDELMNHPFLDFIHPDDVERTRRENDFTNRGLASLRFRNRCRAKDGSYRWLDWASRPTHDGRLFCIARDITQQVRREHELRLWMRVLQAAHNGILITDPNREHNPIVFANAAFERMTGYTEAELIGESCAILQRDDRAQPEIELLREAVRDAKECHVVLRNYRKSGEMFLNSLTISPVRGSDGVVSHYVGIAEDITARTETERAVVQQAAVLRAILDSMQDVVMVANDEGHIDLNNVAKSLFGELLANGIPETFEPGFGLFMPDQKTRFTKESFPLTRALRGESVDQVEAWVRLRDWPEGRWHSITANPVRNDGEALLGAVIVSRDITAKKQLEERLKRSAMSDDLTGLYNRRGFIMMSEQQLRSGARHGRGQSLVFIDLNDMKQINDTLGHEMGDEALIATATLLQSVCRESDIVARLGGDEFVILAEGDEATSEALQSRIAHALEEQNRTRSRFQLSLSVGVAVFDPAAPCTLSELLARADAAMYEVKRKLKSGRPAAG